MATAEPELASALDEMMLFSGTRVFSTILPGGGAR